MNLGWKAHIYHMYIGECFGVADFDLDTKLVRLNKFIPKPANLFTTICLFFTGNFGRMAEDV